MHNIAQITADTMAMNVDLGMNLNTFGFSLSSGHDVDANGYNGNTKNFVHVCLVQIFRGGFRIRVGLQPP